MEPWAEYTLQINLSPGDSDYAELTVPELLRAHPNAKERLLIVDLCKPQRTRIVDPATRFPEPRHSVRSARIAALAAGWLSQGAVDRVETLVPGDSRFEQWRRLYLRPWIRETHDYGGCAMIAYIAAFDLPKTPWLLHYDADMMIHQAAGVDWVALAQAAMANDPGIVASSPRPSPPPSGPDAPTVNERLPSRDSPAGWLSSWFSTRCYLFDLRRLRAVLPLVQGRVFWESVAARILGRGYPKSPEGLLYRRMAAAGLARLTLRSKETWLLHPTSKDARFLAALPRILDRVRAGDFPARQRGEQDLRLETWEGPDA